MDRLPISDRPHLGGLPGASSPTMKDNLGPRFSRAIFDLVVWFKRVERHFDLKTLQTAIEEIVSSNGDMSDLALQTLIRQRYAEKIYAVLQPPAISLNAQDPANSKYVTRFNFAPLTGPSDIRLFKFRKFITLGDQVPYFSCEIVHVNLDQNPTYTAISYVWGPLDNTVPVLVGDDEFIMVTRNLMEVLYRFSGANTPSDTGNTTLLLWSDQLCINQYNSEERGKQVVMMRRIYSQAQDTQLWLGEEDEIANQAFELIRCFESISTTLNNPAMFAATGLDAEEIRRRFLVGYPQMADRIPPVSDPRWKALFQFLDRPWFSRIWVFQEAILSSHNAIGSVVCGQMDCNFIHLYLARRFLWVDWDVTTLPSGFQMVMHLMSFYVYRNLGSFPAIPFTVWQIGGCLHSRDPRDRIFGLLGVQDPEKDIEFDIDYTKSAEDVYIDFTRRCIDRGYGLRVLELIKENKTNESQIEASQIGEGVTEHNQADNSTTAETNTEEALNLPSWVPDWSVKCSTTPLDGFHLVYGRTSGFNACASRSCIASPELESREKLVVKGKIIDCVVKEVEHDFQISTPVQIEQYFAVNFQVRLWFMLIEHGIEIGLIEKATTEQLQAAVIRTLTADGFNDSITSPELHETLPNRLPDEDAIEIYHELERLRDLFSNKLPLPEDWSQAKKDMHLRIWVNTEVCKGRRVALLQKHWIMLGPKNARKWDHITILNGSSVPWVLRTVGREGHFEIVGQCFVDGAMHGNAVDWSEDEADTFVLV